MREKGKKQGREGRGYLLLGDKRQSLDKEETGVVTDKWQFIKVKGETVC